MTQDIDIIIVGGGIVGLTAALALAQSTSFSILLLEAEVPKSKWTPGAYHHRVSAISLASKQIFESLNVWERIKEKRISPYTTMHVIDQNGRGEIQFDSRDIACDVLGYIIENEVIAASLSEKIASHSQVKVISPKMPASFSQKENGMEVITTDGEIYQARCLIAADGAQSWVRRAANIESQQHDYGQVALVANVKTHASHQKMARQVFLANGTLAYLPLADETWSSIVWSITVDEADRLLKLNDTAFMQALISASHSFDDFGKIIEVGRRYQFKLTAHQAKQYVQSRLALVGDAAHTIHPLAGQGINMGLLDAASLADVICDANKRGRDFSTHHALRPYERWRRADNLMMQKGVHAIFNLFNQQQNIVQQLRSFGLDMTNQFAAIKNLFTRYAVGHRYGLPKLAKSMPKESCLDAKRNDILQSP